MRKTNATRSLLAMLLLPALLLTGCASQPPLISTPPAVTAGPAIPPLSASARQPQMPSTFSDSWRAKEQALRQQLTTRVPAASSAKPTTTP